jgi:zinc transport system ATP-binding protein
LSKIAISFEDVCFSYKGMAVLEKVNFEIKAGEFALFTGPNGGGKTTAVKLISSLLKSTSGNVKVYSNSKIGYIAQKKQEFDFFFPISVYEVVELACVDKKLSRQAKRENIYMALDRVGLLELKDRFMDELSGGQRQRVYIARAFAVNPDILIMDEPTSGIDSISKESLASFIADFRRKQNSTVIYVTHDVSEACGMGDVRFEFANGMALKKDVTCGCVH